jgi:two-component system sensor histidine kinase RegB
MSIPSISAENTDLNLRRLLLLRSIAIVCELLTLLAATQSLDLMLPIVPLLMIVLMHASINGFAWLRSRRSGGVVSTPVFALHLAVDTIVLALLLYFAGGYTNPFVSLFLLPLVISASILPRTYTWGMAALTIACYTLLMYYYVPLPEMTEMAHGHGDHGSSFDMHVLGMWFSFLLSVGLIVFFVVKMATSLRERDAALAQAREKALHDEHLVALGTLATGAAHELGTPLSTMAVLANELKYDHADDPEVLEKAEIFRSQVERCKGIISDISATTGQLRAEGGSSQAVDDYLNELLASWQAMRPQAGITVRLEGDQPAPHILADKTLSQALMNILNNAADASLDHVELHASWDQSQLLLDICDQGSGVAESNQGQIGKPFFTTKADGHGLGLYLAKAVLDRYKGSLVLSNRESGGTQARIVLPLNGLEHD